MIVYVISASCSPPVSFAVTLGGSLNINQYNYTPCWISFQHHVGQSAGIFCGLSACCKHTIKQLRGLLAAESPVAKIPVALGARDVPYQGSALVQLRALSSTSGHADMWFEYFLTWICGIRFVNIHFYVFYIWTFDF